MMRFFFDVKASGSIEHDYSGRCLPSLGHAQQMAELIAIDLSFGQVDVASAPEVQIRDEKGCLLCSMPVQLIDALPA